MSKVHGFPILCDSILAVHVHRRDMGEAMTWNVLCQNKDEDEHI